MRKRFLFCFLGLGLAVGFILLCMYIPEYLLRIEKNGDIGHAMEGKSGYYADDISSNDGMEFSLQKRLLMLSGQWKCEKEEIDLSSYEKEKVKFESLSHSIIGMTFNSLVEAYLPSYWEDYIYGTVEVNFGDAVPWGNETQEYAAASKLWENMDASFWSWLDLGKVSLYKYTDKILNTYHFYVWEYRLHNESCGIDIQMQVDAVTKDVYSLSLHGEAFDSIPWTECIIYSFYPREKGDDMGMEGIVENSFQSFCSNLESIEVADTQLVILYQLWSYFDLYGGWETVDSVPKEWTANGYESIKDHCLKQATSVQVLYGNVMEVSLDSGKIQMFINMEKGLDFYYSNAE